MTRIREGLRGVWGLEEAPEKARGDLLFKRENKKTRIGNDLCGQSPILKGSRANKLTKGLRSIEEGRRGENTIMNYGSL